MDSIYIIVKNEHDNPNKYYMYSPLVGGEQVCAECKAKEGADT